MRVWDSQEGHLCPKLDHVVGFLPSGAIPVVCYLIMIRFDPQALCKWAFLRICNRISCKPKNLK